MRKKQSRWRLMANEQNLMSIQEVNSRRSREEHRKDSSKGGKKSAEIKRQRKELKNNPIPQNIHKNF